MTRRSEAWRDYAAGSERDHFARFCREQLLQSEDRWEGQPLKLEPWQRRMLGEALAYDPRGEAVWRSVVMIAPRKNGKTALLAAVALYRLLTDEGRPEILLAASSDRQAGRLFDACARYVRRNPELSELLRVRDHEGQIVREDGMGAILRLTSDPARLYGYSPTLVIVDELAFWTTPNLRRAYAALTSGGGARRAPQTFTITTAGEASTRHDSILGTLLDAALDAEDVEREPGLTISRVPAAKTLLWAYEAPTTDGHDVKALKLANPASWITLAYLRRQAENPELTDAQVLQLHGCVWAATETTWISPGDWMAARRRRQLEPGERVVLGFDGSARRDSTVLAAATLDGFVSILSAWERPEGVREWKVPRQEVTDEIMAAFEGFDVVELACDPYGWRGEIEQWQNLFGAGRVLEFPTASRQRFAPACDRFRADVLEGTLGHDGDRLLARHVGHAVARRTPHGVAIEKAHADSPRRIDAAVAAVIAHDRAGWHAANVVAPFVAAW